MGDKHQQSQPKRRLPGVPQNAASAEDGFALVDALTGLTVLATTIIFAVGAANVARKASVSAAELHTAAPALEYLMATSFHSLGAQEGRTKEIVWRATLSPDAAQGLEAVCRRTAEVRHLKTGRSQTIATLEPCPRPDVQ